MDSSNFNFTKLPGDGFSAVNNWACTGWDDEGSLEVSEYELYGAYPNPFNPTTTISFNLPEASQIALSVYDVNGRQVETLVEGWMNAGSHEVIFNAANFASGIYFCTLQAEGFTATKKLMLVK